MNVELAGVVLMRVDADPPTQHLATLAGGQRELVVLSIDDSIAWNCGENVIVVAGEPGRRRFAQAVYVSPSGRFHLLRKTSSWRRFDARGEERYEARLEARLRTDAGWRATGTISDLSTGGLAIDVSTVPPATSLLVRVAAAGFQAELPISLVSMSDAGAGTRLHCRFTHLSEAQFAFLRALLAAAVDEQEQRAA